MFYQQYPVCVLGAGPVGLWFSLGLVSQGFSVVLVEKKTLFQEKTSNNYDGKYHDSTEERFYALNAHSIDFLKKIEKNLKNTMKNISRSSFIPFNTLKEIFLEENCRFSINHVLVMREGHFQDFSLQNTKESFGYMMFHGDLVAHGLKLAQQVSQGGKLIIYDNHGVQDLFYQEKTKQWTLTIVSNHGSCEKTPEDPKNFQNDEKLSKNPTTQIVTPLLFCATGSLDNEENLYPLNMGRRLFNYEENALVITIKPYPWDIFLEYFHDNGVLAILPIGHEKAVVIDMGPKVQKTEQYRKYLLIHIGEVLEKCFKKHHGSFGAQEVYHEKYRNNILESIDFETPGQLFPLWFSLANSLSYEGGMLLGSSAATVHPLAGYGLNEHFSLMEDLLTILTRDFFHPQELKNFGDYSREIYKNLGLFTTGLHWFFGQPQKNQNFLWPGVCGAINNKFIGPYVKNWLEKKGRGFP